MSDEGKVTSDMLFVGLTRSPTLLGVSYSSVGLNFVSSVLGFIMTSDFRCFLSAIVIHGLLYHFSSKDPLFLDLFMINSKCAQGRVNKYYHRASTYDPS